MNSSDYYALNKNKIKARAKKWYSTNKDKVKERNQTIKSRWQAAKNVAKRRGIKWELSLKEYEMLQKPCFYCNGYFHTVTVGCGLDRIDNLIGYTKNNVVSCCKVCNMVKNSIFSLEETQLMIKTVINNRKTC